MKLGIVREGKIPADNRVPLTPVQCVEVQQRFPGVEVVVQSSRVRCFRDADYREAGIPVVDDLAGCDLLVGVKEVPESELISGRTYLFFSHTMKMQPYNRQLLQTALDRQIRLIDYEALTGTDGFRLLGFGRFAGLVGAYNGLRAFGLRTRLFQLDPAHRCDGLEGMFDQLKNIALPPVKIAVTGDGRVAGGVLEILHRLPVERLSPEQFLKSKRFEKAVYCQLSPQQYARSKDSTAFVLSHFFQHPEMYDNAFLPFARSTDLLIAAAYWDPRAPVLFTADDMKHPAFRIRVISDITCDIDGSVPSTRRASTIDDPFYDYNPETGAVESPFSSEKNVTVQAVDNLPNELPKDASSAFGRGLIDRIFPSLFGADTDAIIARATITEDGHLTKRFSYLRDFADGR